MITPTNQAPKIAWRAPLFRFGIEAERRTDIELRLDNLRRLQAKLDDPAAYENTKKGREQNRLDGLKVYHTPGVIEEIRTESEECYMLRVNASAPRKWMRNQRRALLGSPELPKRKPAVYRMFEMIVRRNQTAGFPPEGVPIGNDQFERYLKLSKRQVLRLSKKLLASGAVVTHQWSRNANARGIANHWAPAGYPENLLELGLTNSEIVQRIQKPI